MKKEYKYFFSYFYSDGRKNVFNHCEITVAHKIESYDDIEDVAENIAKESGYKHNPTILFFKELKAGVEK